MPDTERASGVTALPAPPELPTKSEPPSVRVARAWSESIENVAALLFLAAGFERKWFAVESEFAWMVAAMALGGPAISAVAGRFGKKIPAGPIAAVLALAQSVLGGVGKALVPLAIATALAHALIGCASGPQPVDPVQVQRNADAQQRVVDSIARELEAAGPLVFAGCDLNGKSSELCRALEEGYRLIESGVDAARRAIETYRVVGYGLEAVELATLELERAVAALHGQTREVSNALARLARLRVVDPGPPDMGSQPPPGEPARAVDAEPPAASASQTE